MQYPRFLYPGKEQIDFSDSRFKTKNTLYSINSINPLSWITTAVKIVKCKPELLIIPWWNPFFGICFRIIAGIVKLLSGCKVLFICHNVLPHERIPFQKFLTKLALVKGDYKIVHSKEDEQKLLCLLPKSQYRRHVHPTYNIFKNEGLTKDKARENLAIHESSKVLLFFGFVREYKGLIYLIQALPVIIKSINNVKLHVVGEFFYDKDRYIDEIARLGLTDYIEIFDNYIPDHEVGNYFTASDLVVLPYTSATQSGIVQIAYGFYKPVIVSNVGGLPEVVEHKSTGYIVEPENSEQIAFSVIDFFQRDNQVKFTENIKKQEKKYSWDRLVETIEDLGNMKK